MTITSKNDFFGQLEFITARTQKKISNADVSVVVVAGTKDGEKRYYNRLGLTFRNDVLDLLGDGDRLKIARFKNRLIFVKDPEGMKYSSSTGGKNKFVRFQLNDQTIQTYGWFEGDYDLKYDDLYEYYYIEKDASAANDTRPQA